ncbi:glycoside hydrolase family 61 protein [Trichoderma chlorosporum]
MKTSSAGLLLLGLASLARAHTTFTTLFIDRKDQGDGTCVRMPYNDNTATFPIHRVHSMDMVCGRNGIDPVEFICPANKGSLLTFEYREWPNAQHNGSIDPGHLGPCAVYLKKVDDMFRDTAAGGGWFKIWEDGYNPVTEKWCVDRLVENKGLLSVRLPRGLPAGYYLVRPEILALHWASTRHDPQYFVGCAQIFLNSDVQGPLNIPPERLARIPGYVNTTTPGLTYDIYQDDLPPYPIPGPKVHIPKVSPNSTIVNPNAAPLNQTFGRIPEECVLKSSNWCGRPLEPYTTGQGCWDAVKACYIQSKQCRWLSRTTGQANCELWSQYCLALDKSCEADQNVGPPPFTATEYVVPPPTEIPAVWNDVFEKEK